MRLLVLPLLWLGCSDDSEPIIDTDVEDTGPTPPEPWQVQNTEGAVYIARGPANTLRATATFADSLQGISNPGACTGEDARVCLPAELPGLDESVDVADLGFDPIVSEFYWVGDTIAVGSVQLAFKGGTGEVDDVIYYYGSSPGGVQTNLDVVLGGQWGDFDTTLEVPPVFELIAPTEGYISSVENTSYELKWTPTEKDDLVLLVMQGKDTSKVYNLEDDGSYVLDLTPYADERKTEAALIRMNRETVDANGNSLTMLGTSEVYFEVSSCGPYPNVELSPNPSTNTGFGVLFYYGTHVRTGWDGEELHDFIDDSSFGPVSVSSYIEFEIYDDSAAPSCRLRYDLTGQTTPTTGVTPSGANLWAAHLVTLGPAESTCTSPVLFGDIPETFIESQQWGFGYGPMSQTHRDELEPVFGANWAAVEDNIMSSYISRDGGFTWEENGYGYHFGLSECYTMDQALVIPAPQSGPLDEAVYWSYPYRLNVVF